MRKTVYWGILSLLLAARPHVGVAQQDARDAAAAAKEAIARLGRPIQIPTNLVIVKADGTPLKSSGLSIAIKGLHSSSGGTYATDEQGRLLLSPGFNFGHCALYGATRNLGTLFMADVNLQGAEAAPVQLHLQTGSNLRVVVREAAKAGVAGHVLGGATLAISLIPAPGAEGPNFDRHNALRFPLQSAFSKDTDGVVEVKNLVPAHYRVTAKFAPLFKPVTQEIDVKENATTTAEFALEPETATTLKVSVQNEKGEPLRDTDMSLGFLKGNLVNGTFRPDFSDEPGFWHQDQSMSARLAHTDANGQFTLYPVVTGTWILMNQTAPLADLADNPQIAAFTFDTTEVKIPAEGGAVTLVVKPHQPRQQRRTVAR